jgi:hypothetical protein
MKKPIHKTHRKTGKRRRSVRRAKNKFSAPRTAKQYFAMPREFQELWDRIVQVPTTMRSGKHSLDNASREHGVSPRLVLRLAGSAFQRLRNGRYAAKVSDGLLRILPLPSLTGLVEIALSDSRQASVVGHYWNALQQYLRRGDASAVNRLRKKRIRLANGKHIRLLTDLGVLARLASAGVLRFETIYGRTT